MPHRRLLTLTHEATSWGIREPILTWVSRNADPIPTYPEGRGEKEGIMPLVMACVGRIRSNVFFLVVVHLPSDPMFMIMAQVRKLTHWSASLPKRWRRQRE